MLQASLTRNTNTGANDSKCYASAIVDGQAIASTIMDLGSGSSSADQGTVELETGAHAFGIWAVCNGYIYSDNEIEATLSMKSPIERTLKPIDTSRFLTDG